MKKGYRRSIYKELAVDPGAVIRVYRVYSGEQEFFIVTFNVKGWSIPLGEGYTPWGAVAKATLSPFIRGSEKLERALTLLSQVII